MSAIVLLQSDHRDTHVRNLLEYTDADRQDMVCQKSWTVGIGLETYNLKMSFLYCTSPSGGGTQHNCRLWHLTSVSVNAHSRQQYGLREWLPLCVQSTTEARQVPIQVLPDGCTKCRKISPGFATHAERQTDRDSPSHCETRRYTSSCTSVSGQNTT